MHYIRYSRISKPHKTAHIHKVVSVLTLKFPLDTTKQTEIESKVPQRSSDNFITRLLDVKLNVYKTLARTQNEPTPPMSLIWKLIQAYLGTFPDPRVKRDFLLVTDSNSPNYITIFGIITTASNDQTCCHLTTGATPWVCSWPECCQDFSSNLRIL